MLQNFIDIAGIADPSTFPIITPTDRYKQFGVEEALTIPAAKPGMEQITQVLAEALITGYRVIITPTGLKIIIDGTLTQKIIYVANDIVQSVHSAEFIKNFCNFITIDLVIPANTSVMQLLQTFNVTLDTVIQIPPKVIIEDLSVIMIDARKISKCGILFSWVGLNPALLPILAPK